MTAFLLNIFLVTLPFQFALNPFPGIDLHIARIFSLAIGLIWVFEGLIRKKGLFVSTALPALAFFGFLFSAGLSMLWADYPSAAARRYSFLLSFAPLFFAFSGVFALEGRKALEKFLSSFLMGAFLSALLAIGIFLLQFIFGVERIFRFLIDSLLPVFLGASFSASVAEYPSILVNIGGETLLRASGLFPDPHIAGFFFGMAIPIAASFLAEKIWRPLFATSVLIVLICADFMTFSRGAYLGLAVLLVVSVGVLMQRLSWVSKRNVALALMLVIIIAFAPHSLFSSRLLSTFSLEDGSNQGRIAMWHEAVSHIEKQPYGYGLGNYPFVVKPSAGSREPIYAHNLFLDIATESGILGAVFLAIALVSAIILLLRPRIQNSLLLGCAGALVVFLTHSLVESPLYSVHIFPLLLLLIAIPTGMRIKQSPLC